MIKIHFLLLLVTTLLFPSKIFANDAFLLPKDVSEAFQKLEQPEKSRHCGGVGRHALSELKALSASKPPTKIEGYNSRMDNMAKVVGAEQTDLFFLRLYVLTTKYIN